MITIFFIAFEFPPSNNGGVFRPLGFAKYLPEFGIKPVIFTLHPDSIPIFFQKNITDHTLAKDIPAETEVVYIPINKIQKKSKLKEFFEIRDRNTDSWELLAERILIKSIKKYNPQALLVTAPPFTMASFGRKMAKKLKLPLILDMRDGWTYWNIVPYRTMIHYLLTKREEGKCIKAAAVITVTSQQTLEDFKYLHPSVLPDKFLLITNGYDGKIIFDDINLKNKEKYIIGYSGGFYYSPESRKMMFAKWWQKKPQQWLQVVPRKEDWLYRSPYFFFKSINRLKKLNLDVFNKIEVHFIGEKPIWFDEMVIEHQLQEKVKHLGVYTHKASIQFQKECDILLITSSKVIQGKDYSIAGKTFEYIKMQKPILSFVSEGAQKDILEKTGLALICNPDEDVKSAESIIHLILGHIKLTNNIEFINTISRINLTEKLSQVIKKVISN